MIFNNIWNMHEILTKLNFQCMFNIFRTFKFISLKFYCFQWKYFISFINLYFSFTVHFEGVGGG